jgi:hypothetical protein
MGSAKAMIDRTIRIENLDPETWNNIGTVYDALTRYREVVFVLLHEGKTARIVGPRDSVYPSAAFDPASPQEGAANLFMLNSHAGLVVVVAEESSLIDYYIRAQSASSMDLDGDEFCDSLNGLLESRPGISLFYREGKKRSIYEKLRELVEKRLPKDCTVFIRIKEEGRDFFHCIVGINAGKVRSLTTLDCLGDDVHALLSKKDAELSERIAEHFPGELRTVCLSLDDIRAFAALG